MTETHPKTPRGRELTLYRSEAGDHRGAAGRAGAAAVQTSSLVQVGGRLHRYFVLEVCWTWEKKK